LFKQPPIKLATAETNLPPTAPTNSSMTVAKAGGSTNAPPRRKNPRELPPGAGPLIAEAQRAIDGERFGEAEKKYLEVLHQDEDNVYVLANLAAVQMDQDKTADAEKALTRALAIDPQDPASLYMMGNLRLKQEKYDEAIDLLSQAAKLNPEKPQTQFFLGKALIQKGNRGPAETALRKAVQLKPGWGEPHYLLAVLYATQQPSYPELAQYHYKKAIVGGAPRNLEFERWMENKSSAPAAGH
jgi:predicted Zn-dependent protease